MSTLLLPLMATQAASAKQSTASIVVEADGTEIDALTKKMVLSKVRISQDQYVIQADEARATGLDVDNSEWVFTGQVKITTPDGFSTAERATVRFAQNQITELHVSGRPATFEQRDARKQMLAQGRADNIDYDLQKNTVRLNDQAWVKYGQNEFSGTSVVYDINSQRVLASREEQQGERVRITINPNTGKTTQDAPAGSRP